MSDDQRINGVDGVDNIGLLKILDWLSRYFGLGDRGLRAYEVTSEVGPEIIETSQRSPWDSAFHVIQATLVLSFPGVPSVKQITFVLSGGGGPPNPDRGSNFWYGACTTAVIVVVKSDETELEFKIQREGTHSYDHWHKVA